jgi:NAD(P)-dependent dehydrogenase (short-subunit alcohol dehydrogenase family)
MGRVTGKIALVTGGASGIGRATAQRLAEEDAQVIITDIDTNAGIQTAEDLGIAFLHQDVGDEGNWQQIVTAIVDQFSGLHILVNNAGIGELTATSDPESTTLEEWNRTMSVNATGTFLGCKTAIPAIRDSGGGSIINLSSIAALVATPFITAYGASKAAVRQLTTSVAVHCAEAGYKIRCNSIHPGQIRTPMLDGLFDGAATNSGLSQTTMQSEFLKKIPLGEFGQAADIAHAVLFLASDESRHMTGAQLVIDGGMQVYR